MKRFIVLMAVAAIVIAAVPTVAEAFPRLGAGEAARATGHRIRSEWNGVIPGTLRARCPLVRSSPNLRRCYYTYRMRGANRGRWCGVMSVRETYNTYYTRILRDYRC
jgi:hypothetical protein